MLSFAKSQNERKQVEMRFAHLKTLHRFDRYAESKRRVTVRQMMLDDIPEVVRIQKRVYTSMAPWSAEYLAQHLALFPEGQIVAVDDSGRIVGSASSLIIDWDDYAESANWSAITGAGRFNTHNPLGKTLYGADIGVDPPAAPHRLSAHLASYSPQE
jgi:hypothetical protein